MTAAPATWVFGYGSLIWKQDFPYREAREGWIEGWARRFWQGSHDHRGLPHDPGRVVTLVPQPGVRCHGRAFLVAPDVFAHLDHREKNGYQRLELPIHLGPVPVRGCAYFAPAGNPAFLGPAPLDEMARQINRCHGPSGSNRDYVLALAAALRAMGIVDEHVEAVARAIAASA